MVKTAIEKTKKYQQSIYDANERIGFTTALGPFYFFSTALIVRLPNGGAILSFTTLFEYSQQDIKNIIVFIRFFCILGTTGTHTKLVQKQREQV